MMAQHAPLPVEDRAGPGSFRGPGAQKAAIITVRQKTQVLALGARRRGQPTLGCQRPDLRLGVATYREKGMGQLGLAQHVKDVRLVLGAVGAPPELVATVRIAAHPRIVPRRQVGRAQRAGVVEKIPKTDLPVTSQAWIGRASR